jgi:hypothetical protein
VRKVRSAKEKNAKEKNTGALKITTSSQGLRPAEFLRSASLLRSSPLISAAFKLWPEEFERNHRGNSLQADRSFQ